jgi:ABC-type sugar transport system ATPase subunit
MPDYPVIQTKGICKSFTGPLVLENIDFDLEAGEIHALIGENGAGKSTLMKIICGVFPPSSGVIFLNGTETSIPSPHKAAELGIVLIHQEPLIFPDLNVTENIFAGHSRQSGKPFIRWREKVREAEALISPLNVNFKPGDKVAGMSVADQQMVEIASALSQNARVIVMDEPTAALTSEEVRNLFKITRMLKSEGRSIIFISHKLNEIKAISDRVTVLRDGKKIATKKTTDVSQDDIIRMMVGRSITEQIPKETAAAGELALEVKNLTRRGQFRDVSIFVRKGEIVGLAGLVGSGRTEVAQCIFGITQADSGSVMVGGKPLAMNSPAEAIGKKLAYVTEDRQHDGLFLDFSVAGNITSAAYWKVYKGGFFRPGAERQIVSDYVEKLRIRLHSVKQKVKELSGGNQQKTILSKWLLCEPDVLILDEPTRGIDVGAKAEVYRLINELAKQEKAILMISSEMTEILGLSDRTYVMHEGSVSAVLDRNEMTEEAIMLAAIGEGKNNG